MQNDSQVLIDLLACFIHNQKPDMSHYDTIDWEALYEEAKEHQVHTLLYPIISDLCSDYKPADSIISLWQMETLKAATGQVQHMEKIKELLSEFHQKAIPVVILKGLILRDYYPQPELRTMSDSDILIRKIDLKRVKSILLEHGYKEGDTSYKHQIFLHEYYLNIEVHSTLFDHNKSSAAAQLSDTFMKNADKAFFYGSQVLILPPDEQILHLLMHTADHLLNTGFGLRQLCDLILFIEANSDRIYWEYIKGMTNELGLNRYASSIFIICNKLFDFPIPDVFKEDSVQEPYIELLIEDILLGGVYGKRTPDRENTSRIYKYADEQSTQTCLSNILTILTFLFPPAKKMGYKYTYARKYPILLPLAWIHRAIYNINRGTSFSLSAETMNKSKERARLLHWLQLR
jgi:hypothetical protein